MLTVLIPSIILIISIFVPANVFGASKFRLEGTLIDDPLMTTDNYYILKSANISLTKGSKLCPSDSCVITIAPLKDLSFSLSPLETQVEKLQVSGDIRISDNVSNSKFTPLKKALVENVHLGTICTMRDIQEDQATNRTKYICGTNPDLLALTRVFNDTNQLYHDVTMSFELPSKHITLEATEGYQ